MPLADRVCVVALVHKDLGEEPVLDWHRPVVARVAGRPLADRTHGVRMVVAAGDDAGAGRRTEPRGVEVRIQDACVSNALEVRCWDQPTERSELTEAGVIQYVEQHVWRALGRLLLHRPGLCRVVDRLPDFAGKFVSG